MEMTFWIFVLLFFAVIFLIFKFIKKLVYAVITLVVFVLLIIGTVFGLVWADYNYLVGQKDYTVKLALETDKGYSAGVDLPVKDSQVQIEEAKSSTDLAKLDPEEITSDSGIILVTINDDLYYELVKNVEIEIPGVPPSIAQNADITLNGEEIIEIVQSDEPKETLMDIVFENNQIEENSPQRLILEPQFESAIDEGLGDVDIKDAIVAYSLQEAVQDQDNLVQVLEGFKDEDVNIYPERFTVKMARWFLPVDLVTENLNLGNSDEEVVE